MPPHSLAGVERWRALVASALADLNLGTLSRATPILIASCNGSAVGSQGWEEAFDTAALFEGTPWANERVPVFSSSCASGIHALYAARQLLAARAVDEVLVVAADILSQVNHENFESLRVLAEKPSAPWQSGSVGFILGEAAVALKVVRAGDGLPVLNGPELGSDVFDGEGLSHALEELSPRRPSLILGQGTGPFAVDASELAAISEFVDKSVPLATPLSRFGHTLGASALLAVALGASGGVSCLGHEGVEATDGRPLLSGLQRVGDVLATCRALNGACSAVVVGDKFPAKTQRSKGKRELGEGR